ncbi:sensor histidine kinase [Spirosoma radiotolerans]|uniref:Signal transduction histidine kinase internal region domain-containing protein n=1 Tax=Spirosoma radiotolerans TaxID=1379870 RepID=A0A0E3ZXY2_9BACT|nr:histidine kinase [Spirosoma radiotolerans]AKD57178.1 hypothetical protein SD10_22065 [Spirosoma radiotolerans]
MNASIDTKLRLIGPLVLFVCGTLFFRLNTVLDFNYADLYRYDLVGIVAGFINWHIARWVLLRLQVRYPGIERTRRRSTIYGLLLPILIVIGTLLRTEPLGWLGLESTSNAGFEWFELDSAGTTSFRQYVLTAGIQLFYHSIYWGIYEGIYLFRQWQQLYQEKERLIKAEWQARFDALKSQVNPHFLFNALNALSSLIDESPAQAGQYVDQLAKVYRYLLQANERELTSLKAELTFIESYAHLLRTRYGAGFSLQVEVPAHDQTYLVPPLTLQLLVENAVKHNVVQVKYPLLVEIKTTRAGQLMVRNNLQRKSGRVLSHGVGLSSIAIKFQMMEQPDIAIQEADGYFTVLLPLVQA